MASGSVTYADDTVLLDSSIERIWKLTEGVEDEGRKVGLCMNVSKCKVMVSNKWNDMYRSENWKFCVRGSGRLLLAIWGASCQVTVIVIMTV